MIDFHMRIEYYYIKIVTRGINFPAIYIKIIIDKVTPNAIPQA